METLPRGSMPVRLYDMEELRRFERAAERLKKELRRKH
jgi:hypothetical protein